MPNLKKINTVDTLKNTLKKASHYILFNFGSTSHQQFEELRKKLRREKEAHIQVVKNSLLKIAAQKAGKKELVDQKNISGPSALFTLPRQWNAALSSFYQYIKKEGTVSLKIGVIDKVVYGKDELQRIAELPPKEILRSHIVNTLKSPSTRLVYAMKWSMIRIVHVIKKWKAG